MAFKPQQFRQAVDFDQNEVINIVLFRSAGPPPFPSGKTTYQNGQLYHDTTLNLPMVFNGTTWVPWGYSEAGDGLEIDPNISTRTFNVLTDDVTITINNNNEVIIKDQGVSTAKIKDDNVTTVKVKDKNITLVKIQDLNAMRVIGSIGGGTPEQIVILDEDDFASDSATALATQQSIKAFIMAKVAGIGRLVGGFAAGTATQFPQDTPSTDAGDTWFVTSAGTVQGMVLNIGDTITANKANASPTNPNDWFAMETNRDQATTTVLGVIRLAAAADVSPTVMVENTKAITPAILETIQATNTKRGIQRNATAAEVAAGTAANLTVTPITLKARLDEVMGAFVATIGNASATDFVITHTMNTKNVLINVFETATGAEVGVHKERTSATSVTIAFGANSVPTANQYTVVISKGTK